VSGSVTTVGAEEGFQVEQGHVTVEVVRVMDTVLEEPLRVAVTTAV